MPTLLPTALLMPAAAVAALLPNPTLSILQLLEFPLPPSPSHVILSKSQLFPSAYFSFDQPNVEDLQIIKTIPHPPLDVIGTLLSYVAALTHHAESTASESLGSVLCAHIGGVMPTQCLPLWIITYWTEALHLRNTIQQPWIAAERALQLRSQFRIDFCGGEAIAKEVEEDLGRGKRKRKANTLYSHRFWLSHDNN